MYPSGSGVQASKMGEVLGPSLWDTLLGVRLRQLLCRGHGFPNQQVLSCVFRRVNPLNGLVFRKGPHLNRDCVMRKSFVFNMRGVKLESGHFCQW